MENLDDLLQCKGLCFFRECDYLVHSGTDCYLGDFGVTSSIIDTQADSKDVYIYDGNASNGNPVGDNGLLKMTIYLLYQMQNSSAVYTIVGSVQKPSQSEVQHFHLQTL